VGAIGAGAGREGLVIVACWFSDEGAVGCLVNPDPGAGVGVGFCAAVA
jgi:hypothetical protein